MNSLLKPQTKTLLTKAIGNELYASNLYKNLANQAQSLGFFGAQKYFLKESEQELSHYQIIADYINDRGDVAEVPMVEKQTDKAKSLTDAFEFSLEAEIDLEKFYVEFYEEAEDKLKDCVTAQFLLQFIEIQRKSIGEVKDILAMLKIAGTDAGALLIIDKKLDKV